MKSKCPYDLVSRDVYKDVISNVVKTPSKRMYYQTQKTHLGVYKSTVSITSLFAGREES